ncbi:MAG TPA: bifunctional 3'-5' exonuclease/DNA polymerase [Streptosporangiaceae bacterium]|nr:bifunctional 3'-5' exonuclease/DNA polymerase [Streptosporangiaceae bacterium]
MRVAVIPGPGRSGMLCPLTGEDAGAGALAGRAVAASAPVADGLAASAASPRQAVAGLDAAEPLTAEPEAGAPGAARQVPDLASAIAEYEQAGDVRWVWPATAELYPALLRAGVRVARCHDIALTEALLLGREGSAGPASLAAAAARLRGLPVPQDRRPAPSGPQQSLFELDDPAESDAGAMAAALADLLAVHADQQARIAADAHPARFALLAATESAGGLTAAEMAAAGLPWRPDVHDRLLTEALGSRPPASAGPAARPPRLADLAARITAAFGVGAPINPDSPAQVARALAGEGVRVPSTRLSVLRQIDHPAIPLLVEYKELSRLYTAFGWSWLDTWVSGGRFRPEYVVGGVVSGRWASRGGGALQIPRALRRAVVADPGWVLVVADAAQLEPRVLAALAGDAAFAEAAAGGDLYQALASALGGDRAMAKVALLSAMYGGSGGDAGQLLAVLRRRFPRASDFVETAARAGEEGRTVRSALGRTCPPPSADWRSATIESGDPEAERDPGAGRAARARGRFTRNFVVQASAADWALVLLASLRGRLHAIGGSGQDSPQLVFFQHDEVIVHCPEGQADQVVAAAGAAAAEAGRLLFGSTRVNFPMTTAVVDCYADAK